MAHSALFYLPYHHRIWQYRSCAPHTTTIYTGRTWSTTGTIGAVYIMSSLHHVTWQVVEVMPPEVDNVVDTTGAGDAFLGGLIVGR